MEGRNGTWSILPRQNRVSFCCWILLFLPSPPTFCFFCASRMRATRLDMRALSDVPFHLYLLESHSVRGKGLFRFGVYQRTKKISFLWCIFTLFSNFLIYLYFLGLYISTAIGDSQNERHFSPRNSYVSAVERSFWSLFKTKARMLICTFC